MDSVEALKFLLLTDMSHLHAGTFDCLKEIYFKRLGRCYATDDMGIFSYVDTVTY